MASLYRKYRPQTFAEVVGQAHIKLALKRQLEKGDVDHAYLFCGPRGLGKTTMARLLAKAVNCQQRKAGEFEPCNKCESCLEISRGQAMDVIEIDAASHTGVDNVRENIIENVRFAPHKAGYKVFIIDEVHMLSISAFNALLKTLEEPPAHSLFILCTTEIHKVPETIISRCQRFDFKKIEPEELMERLKKIARQEKVKLDKKILEVIALRSGGSMRDAESLLGQIMALGEKEITYEQVKSILPSSSGKNMLELLELMAENKTGEAIGYLNSLVDKGIDLEVLGSDLIELLRQLILVKLEVIKLDELNYFFEQPVENIRKLLEKLSVQKMASIIKALWQALNESKTSLIQQLPWELAIIKLSETKSADETGKDQPISGGLKGKINNLLGSKGKKAEKKEREAEDKTPDKAEEEEDGRKEEKAQAATKENGEQPPTSAENNKVKFSLDEIKGIWDKAINLSRQKNLDLMFISREMFWPIKLKGKRLLIGFKYDLHKSRFEKEENINSFKQALVELLDAEFELEAKTLKPSELVDLEIAEEEKRAENEEMSGVKVTEENILDVVLQSFGGEVIEGGES